MKIAIVGTGYVGLVTGVCLAEIGHNVTCIDIDEEKIKELQSGNSPIYEKDLEELLKKNIRENRLYFTSEYRDGIPGADVIFITVGTPSNEDGSANIDGIKEVANTISNHISKDVVVAMKSTVPVGTNHLVKEIIESHVKGKVHALVASNPEFLREGSAVHDMFHGDRIVIGVDEEEAATILERLYEPLQLPIVKTDIRSAEMIKYASNTFLAAKISFINEMANICEKVGANIDDVALGIGKDKRIGSEFLQAGIGFGGSCFPKDIKALEQMATEQGINSRLMKTITQINEKQQVILVDKAQERFGDLAGKKITIFGLSFKPNTDDIREAPSLRIVDKLVKLGANVTCFDPAAMKHAKNNLPRVVSFAETIEDALVGAEAAFILTEWKDFKEYSLEQYVKLMKDPIIFDGRNCYELTEVKKQHIEYHSIGRQSIMINERKGM